MPIQVISNLEPKNSGSFPTHHSEYGKGGWHEVANTTVRDAIPDSRLSVGMIAYVIDEGQAYVLQSLSPKTWAPLVTEQVIHWDGGVVGTTPDIVYLMFGVDGGNADGTWD